MHNECKTTHEMDDDGLYRGTTNTEIGSGDVEYIEERETDCHPFCKGMDGCFFFVE